MDGERTRTRSRDDRDRDDERDHHRHRHRHRDEKEDGRDSRSGRSDGHRDDERRHRHSSHYRSSRGPPSDDETDRRRERSQSKDRVRESVERGRSREESVERAASSRKRKEHGREVDDDEDKGDKRARVSDRGKEERRERRRFEDRPSLDDPRDANGLHRDEKGGERKRRDREKSEERIHAVDRRFKDKVKEEQVSDREMEDHESRQKEGGDSHREEKRKHRRFSDRIKDEELDESKPHPEHDSKRPSSDPDIGRRHSSVVPTDIKSEAKGVALDGFAVSPDEPKATAGHSITPKVYVTTTTNENGVNINRPDEVHGKSSTDGPTAAAAGRSGSLSLDVLATAKQKLQKQKELKERLMKLGKLSGLGANSKIQTGVKEAAKAPSILPSTAASSSSGQTISGPSSSGGAGALTVNPSTFGVMPALPGVAMEAIKKLQEVAEKNRDPQFPPINIFPRNATEVGIVQKPAKTPVLRLDAQGREVDEYGNVINMSKPTNLSTLKVNINKQKKEAFQILKPDLESNLDDNPHFDASMGINKAKLLRPKRTSFMFVEEGRWSRQAEIIRFKSQFGEAQAKELKTKQAQLARAKGEPDINPNLIEVSERVITKEKQKEPIPDVEWWDAPILSSGTYSKVDLPNLNMERITIYVEHPLPIQPPAEPIPPPPQPLKLTKRETKKLRTQRRLAKEKDRQEMIRQGLIEPPKPKVKMSNLMKVLGSEATQDPTRLEMEIRSAAAEREQAHVDRNIARKLTPAERREKKERKLFDDSNTLETFVTVYRVNSLAHPKTRFQVDVNAQENRLTGCAVISDGLSVVVVEGGRKSNKRYKNLMLKRIDWAAVVETEDDGGDTLEAAVNKCSLVWEGSVARPNFNRFLVHQCRTDTAARKLFSDAGVPHYWDLAVNYSEDT